MLKRVGRAERPEREPLKATTMFSAFQIRSFRWVWSGALSGNSGRFAVILVAGWEAYRLGHHSSLWPSLVSLLLLVPSMVLGLFAGSVADRYNRAHLAAFGQSINALACGLAALLTVAGALNLTDLLVLTGFVGVGNSIQAPAWQAMVPGIVGPERLLNAGMTTRIAQQGAELTGPAIGTIVLTGAGPGAAFLLCALFYVVGLFVFLHLRHEVSGSHENSAAQRVKTPVSAGLAYVRRQEPLGILLLWVGLHCSLTMASVGVLPALASTNLGRSVGAYGLLLAAFGFGSIAGPLLMMWLSVRVSTVNTLVFSSVLSGLPLVTLGLTHSLWFALASSAVAGGSQAVFMGAIYSANQGIATGVMRGRVASVQLSLTTGAMGITSVGWGALVGLLSPGLVLVIPGTAFVLLCVPFIRRRKAIGLALSPRQQEALEAQHLEGPKSPCGRDLEPLVASELELGTEGF